MIDCRSYVNTALFAARFRTRGYAARACAPMLALNIHANGFIIPH